MAAVSAQPNAVEKFAFMSQLLDQQKNFPEIHRQLEKIQEIGNRWFFDQMKNILTQTGSQALSEKTLTNNWKRSVHTRNRKGLSTHVGTQILLENAVKEKKSIDGINRLISRVFRTSSESIPDPQIKGDIIVLSENAPLLQTVARIFLEAHRAMIQNSLKTACFSDTPNYVAYTTLSQMELPTETTIIEGGRENALRIAGHVMNKISLKSIEEKREISDDEKRIIQKCFDVAAKQIEDQEIGDYAIDHLDELLAKSREYTQQMYDASGVKGYVTSFIW